MVPNIGVVLKIALIVTKDFVNSTFYNCKTENSS